MLDGQQMVKNIGCVLTNFMWPYVPRWRHVAHSCHSLEGPGILMSERGHVPGNLKSLKLK